MNETDAVKADNDLTALPVPKLVRQIAIPASVGFFFNTMYNVVDTYYGGLISTQALAALSLSFPLFFIIISIGSGMSTGATALMATALGARDTAQAKMFAVQGMVFALLLSVFIASFGRLASPLLFSILGASEGYLSICLQYMNTIFSGSFLFMLLYMLNAVLNAHGETKPFRNFLIFGFGMNVILDPWFIYGGYGVPALGIKGIALATLLIQLLGCVYLSAQVTKNGFIAGCTFKDAIPRLRSFKEIGRQGFPASVNTLTVGVGIFVITYFISRFGKEAVAAYGIATRIEQIALLPSIGLNIATLTLVAQNNGAGLYDRIYESLRIALKYGCALMSVGTVVVFIFASRLMAVFTNNPAVISVGAEYLRIASFLLYAYVILYVNVAVLQGLKKPMFAVWIGIFRQMAAPAIVFYAAAEFLNFGLPGIWWGIFSINWMAALIAILYSHRLLKEVARPSRVAS